MDIVVESSLCAFRGKLRMNHFVDLGYLRPSSTPTQMLVTLQVQVPYVVSEYEYGSIPIHIPDVLLL